MSRTPGTLSTLNPWHVSEQDSRVVSSIAFLWGLLAFLPVGVNYLGLLALLVAVLWRGDVPVRWARLKDSWLYPALLFFAGWTLWVLAWQDHWYDKTPSNLWHEARIFITLALAASLSSNEAKLALKGFMCGCAVVVALVLAHHAQLIPLHPFWSHLIIVGANKTIGASILLSLAAGILLARLLTVPGQSRWLSAFALIAVLSIVTWGLSKRTGMLTSLMAMGLVVVHLWRHHPWRWSGALVVIVLLASLTWNASPVLQAQFHQGIQEVQEGFAGAVKVESWNVRIQMLKHTLDMMVERPYMGWGVGAWNAQWQQRVPVEIGYFNMPHNDALWMGAQAGVLGSLSWLFLMLSPLGLVWKSRSWMGAAATGGICVATFSALVNNGTRDAIIGLPMLWVMGVLISSSRVQK